MIKARLFLIKACIYLLVFSWITIGTFLFLDARTSKNNPTENTELLVTKSKEIDDKIEIIKSLNNEATSLFGALGDNFYLDKIEVFERVIVMSSISSVEVYAYSTEDKAKEPIVITKSEDLEKIYYDVDLLTIKAVCKDSIAFLRELETLKLNYDCVRLKVLEDIVVFDLKFAMEELYYGAE